MSQVMESIDAKAFLSGWLHGLQGMYAADIRAIPEEKWTATFGGCTRPANELTGDALAMLEWVTDAIRGNVRATYGPEDMEGLTEKCRTREGAITALKASTQAFNDALNAASNETLLKPIMAPWGMESPLYSLAQIAVSHIWYHDGQLNYIQCLLGDDKVHWMGD
ncbi:MAG: hypothetical protein HONBIEJF_00840 [Fimbriimonadaceae bacterium]|nr:hypothetical protein [Fimbriimonadaceae bacterium]